MKDMGSYIADNIMREYEQKKRRKINQERKEHREFIKNNCENCKNKTTDLCHVVRNINGEWSCPFKEI